MDLHLHTPASVDYREANVSYLDFLLKAEERGLDIVAFTDHNTVAGYSRYLEEVESLALLERLNRITDAERAQLKEYRRLRDKLLILPGFELTATLGFHVLGIFPPDTSVRELEHLLLDLRVPPERLDLGSGEVGATSDVMTAYALIDEAGGLVIAAHANSSHGVAMPGFDFGGQTRISYTQDEHLHALEVTDLTSRSRRRTALFFSGTKPEYPRRMHLIQSSDAHRLTGIPNNNQELGIGDRPTEILLPELSFEAMRDVFLGNDFARIRPYVPTAPHEYDLITAAREEGETLVQTFHEHVGRGRAIDRKILQDVVALANTNGGTIYLGVSANLRALVQGVQRPAETIHQLKAEISKHVVPPVEVQLDAQKTGGKNIIRVLVPRGSEVPYAMDGTQIFIRSENETSLAVRDEIVNLVRDALAVEFAARAEFVPTPQVQVHEVLAAETPVQAEAPAKLAAPPPHTGVEVVSGRARGKGDAQYTMRDLRNNRVIHNVTRSSARKLWQYAITEFEEHPAKPSEVQWVGDLGIWKANKRAGKVRYDLVQRDSTGQLHTYYGVTEDGIHGPWKVLIETEGGEPLELPEIEAEEASETMALETTEPIFGGIEMAEAESVEEQDEWQPEPESPFDQIAEMAETADSADTNFERPQAETEFRESFPGWERFERPTYIEAETRSEADSSVSRAGWWTPGADSVPKADFAEAVAAQSTPEITPEPNRMDESPTGQSEASPISAANDISGETTAMTVKEPGAENIDSNPDAAVTVANSETKTAVFNEMPTQMAATEALSDTEDDTPTNIPEAKSPTFSSDHSPDAAATDSGAAPEK